MLNICKYVNPCLLFAQINRSCVMRTNHSLGFTGEEDISRRIFIVEVG